MMMSRTRPALFFALSLLVSASCVGDIGEYDYQGVDAGPAAPEEPEQSLRLELSPLSLDLSVDEVRSISARVLDADDVPQPRREVSWTSNAPAIATVDGGEVTGRSPGTALIQATSGDLEASVVINVSAVDTEEPPAPDPDPTPGTCQLEERNNEDSCADVYDGEDLWEAAISSDFDGREVSQVCRDIGDGPRWYTFNLGPLIDACDCGPDFSTACCAENPGTPTPGCPGAN